ncbi:MAG TPA: CcdC protein domain-containing protein [Ktedonobacterales bacterium]
MSIDVIITVALALALVIFIFARQMMQRPVTQRGLLLPVVVCVVLGGVFLARQPALVAVAAVGIGVLLGVGTGLISGQVMRVWRDEAPGVVWQRGGWRYLIAVIALLLVRVLIRFVLIWRGIAVDEAALNAAFIAAIVGNFLGRDIVIALRALPLAGGSFAKLSNR